MYSINLKSKDNLALQGGHHQPGDKDQGQQIVWSELRCVLLDILFLAHKQGRLYYTTSKCIFYFDISQPLPGPISFSPFAN